MKIICTKEEFSKLVRNCQESQFCINFASCSGCLFSWVCGQDGNPGDGDIMGQIEDICEIEVSNG